MNFYSVAIFIVDVDTVLEVETYGAYIFLSNKLVPSITKESTVAVGCRKDLKDMCKLLEIWLDEILCT